MALLLSVLLLLAPVAVGPSPRADEVSAIAVVEEMNRELLDVEAAAARARDEHADLRRSCLDELRLPLRRSVADAMTALARAHAPSPAVRAQALASLRLLARVARALSRRADRCGSPI